MNGEAKDHEVKLTTDLFKKETFYCKPCSKPFKSKNKLEDHMKSKKHKKNLNRVQATEKVVICDISADDLASRCLFCHFKSDDFNILCQHMHTCHSFFILG